MTGVRVEVDGALVHIHRGGGEVVSLTVAELRVALDALLAHFDMQVPDELAGLLDEEVES